LKTVKGFLKGINPTTVQRHEAEKEKQKFLKDSKYAQK
jgi:hypothetical protein